MQALAAVGTVSLLVSLFIDTTITFRQPGYCSVGTKCRMTINDGIIRTLKRSSVETEKFSVDTLGNTAYVSYAGVLPGIRRCVRFCGVVYGVQRKDVWRAPTDEARMWLPGKRSGGSRLRLP